jgi:predicted ATPase with chaperone activity
LSGPLLDRFDLRIDVHRPDPRQLLGVERSESSSVIAERVRVARGRANDRGVRCNAELSTSALERTAPLMAEASSRVGFPLEECAGCGGLRAQSPISKVMTVRSLLNTSLAHCIFGVIRHFSRVRWRAKWVPRIFRLKHG